MKLWLHNIFVAFQETATKDDVTSDKNSIPATPFIATFGMYKIYSQGWVGFDQVSMRFTKIILYYNLHGLAQTCLELVNTYFTITCCLF